MKKIFFSIITAAAVFTGCNREVIEQNGSGSLKIDLSCKSDLNEVETRATDDEIINNLVVDIRRPYDNWSVNYNPFSSIRGKVVELGSGDYILTVSSPVKEHAAFEQPIYEGSKDFKILTGQVTTIDVICSITNTKVTVNLSSNFVEELAHYTVTVTNGKGTLMWNKTAQDNDFDPVVIDGKTYYTGKQTGWFTTAPLTVTIDGHRAIDNTYASATKFIEDVNPADHHILNIDAKVTGQLGDVDENGNVIKEPIKITISHDVNPIDQTVVVPGFDEVPVPGDDPSSGDDNTGDDNTGDDNTGDDNTGGEVEQPVAVITWDANPSCEDMLINADMNADMVISVPGKIAEFEVTVDSPQLTAAIEGLTSDGSATMNLITDEGLIAFLAEAAPALPTGTNLSGKTQVDFFLTEFINMISMFGPASGDKHNFTLDIVDEAGKTFSKTLTFVTE
ncbi:MAG: DUF4493 domain-containing protein [Bacteroidales bacterium]|nr:DUF4493 domain-containing protein [Bacteroidales bacterium]